MANEIAIEYAAGEGTLYAIVRRAGTNLRWDGSDFVAASTISAAAWTTGQVTLTEEATSDAIGTGVYYGDLPGDETAWLYAVEAYLSSARAAADISVATQDVEWTGTIIEVPGTSGVSGTIHIQTEGTNISTEGNC